MIEILAVRNCKYVKADNSVIDCEAKFSHLGDSSQDWLPFTATNSDTEEHGRAIYNNAVNGDYGTVTAFSRTLDEELRDIRLKRKPLLEETDFYANSDVTMSDDMRTYRQNLRDITNGLDTVEKAQNVTWPSKP
jgi:TPP-dependent pyruvate/acetoin dehydrogenase alpha subunit